MLRRVRTPRALSSGLLNVAAANLIAVQIHLWMCNTAVNPTVSYATLAAQAGQHTLLVEWRKWGSYVRAWRNSPSFLDGFAMSRFVVAMGERFDMASQHFLTPVVLKDPLNEWHTVGGKQLEFYLHGPATALFTYGLPVTQVSQHIPNAESFLELRYGDVFLLSLSVDIFSLKVIGPDRNVSGEDEERTISSRGAKVTQ